MKNRGKKTMADDKKPVLGRKYTDIIFKSYGVGTCVKVYKSHVHMDFDLNSDIMPYDASNYKFLKAAT